jgi:hypothetical protein
MLKKNEKIRRKMEAGVVAIAIPVIVAGTLVALAAIIGWQPRVGHYHGV